MFQSKTIQFLCFLIFTLLASCASSDVDQGPETIQIKTGDSPEVCEQRMQGTWSYVHKGKSGKIQIENGVVRQSVGDMQYDDGDYSFFYDVLMMAWDGSSSQAFSVLSCSHKELRLKHRTQNAEIVFTK